MSVRMNCCYSLLGISLLATSCVGCGGRGFDLEYDMPVIVENIELTIDSKQGREPEYVGNNTYRIKLDESGKAKIPDTWPVASWHRTFIKTPVGRMVQIDDFQIRSSKWKMASKTERFQGGVRSYTVNEGSRLQMQLVWRNPSVKAGNAESSGEKTAPKSEGEK